jgi:hypothetical protein
MPTVAARVLQDRLPNYHRPTLMDLARRVGVPVEVLRQVTRATPPKRRGPKPAQPPTGADRDDHCWREGDLTLDEPEKELT